MFRSLKKYSFFLFVLLVLSSCASLSPNGVGVVKRYNIYSEQLPTAFEGYSIAFVSDLHYQSKFTHKRLVKLVGRLHKETPDALLLGGDYVTSNSYIEELFDSISSVKTTDGIYAVLGNHERLNKKQIAESLDAFGVILLDDKVVEVKRGTDAIYIAGVYDSFKYDSLVVQPAERVPDSAFTILLCHTPDYAERSATTADLVLSGHTHGGQVSLLGIYTPVKNTIYGNRFLKGMNETSTGSVIITTTGVGTSRRKVRFCVPSELVLITLYGVERDKKDEILQFFSLV